MYELELKSSEMYLSYRLSVLHKSHMDWLGIELVPPKWQAVTNRLRNAMTNDFIAQFL
jgi:hypothetical protein